MSRAPQLEVKPETSSFWTGKPFRFLVIILALAVSVAIFALRDKFAELAAFGYAGIFLVSLLSSATIILPAPSLALVFAMGSALPWLPVGLAAGAGEALGELTGYAAGFGGQAIIENQKVYLRLQRWMAKRGDITILVLSIIPNPFFDLAGIIAGTMGFPIWRFLLITWLGKSMKTTLVAWAGSQSVALIEQLVR
jgi:membrane protein YqaA with SNARE-associated domain